MGNPLILSALIITLAFVGGLFLVLSRLAKRAPRHEPASAPKPTNQATIVRVLSTDKLNRHELKINLLLEVKPLNAVAYEAETAWIIRVGRIVGMQPGQTFPVEITDRGAVVPLVSWAKLWREGYIPPPRD